MILTEEERKQTLALNRKLTSAFIGHSDRVIHMALVSRIIGEQAAGIITAEELDALIASTRAAIPAAREAARRTLENN